MLFSINWKVLLALLCLLKSSVPKYGKGGKGRMVSAVPEMHTKEFFLAMFPACFVMWPVHLTSESKCSIGRICFLKRGVLELKP